MNATATAKQPRLLLTTALIDKPGMRSEWCVIKPSMAKVLIADRNGHNRSMSDDKLAQLRHDLKTGQYAANGESIIFDWNGQLTNGQHRLQASAETGIEIISNVVFGVDPASMLTVDQGKGRSAGDILTLEGYSHGSALATLSRAMIAYQTGDKETWNRWGNVSRAEIREYVVKHPNMVTITEWAYSHVTALKMLAPVTVLALSRAILEPVYGLPAIDFLESVINGTNLQVTDPAMIVRNRMMSDRVAKYTVSRQDQAEIIMRGCVAEMEGRTISYIRVLHAPPTFPQMKAPVAPNPILDDGSDLA